MSADQEPGSGATQKLIGAIAPTLLIGLNLLIFGTFAVYGENRGEFLISYSSALRLYYLPGLAVFIALGLLSMALGPRSRRTFNALILFLGVITYIHGNLLLWHTGILDGTALDFSKTWRSLVDVILWLTLAWAAFRYRNWLMLQGWKICVVLILFQTIGAFSILYDEKEEPTAKLDIFPAELEMFSTHTNVIHIVLDGFQANIFEELLTKHPSLADHFSGFTFFRDATTPSNVTYLSVPATLSGKPFKNQQSISKYLDKTLHGDNLYRFLAAKGFKVDVATPLWWNQSNSLFSSYYRIPTPYAGQQETLRSSVLLLADISLYRQAPHFLKPMIYRSGTWLLSAMLVSDPEQQFEHFAHTSFVSDLQNRMSVTSAQPRYKFIHLVTPHAPFVSSSDCTFAGTTLEYSKEAFTQQSFCALKTIIAFLDQLKVSGIYDNSMLIIHGDHGGGVPFDMLLENGDKTNSTEALYQMWGNPLPLVLIKPPGAVGTLHISDHQVQLLDVPVTVAQLLGFSSEFPGKSMFEDHNGAVVERVYFQSKIHRNEAMTKDSFDEFTGYRISGSVYRVASWQQAESFQAPVINDAGRYVWGTRISFGNHGNYREFQNGGWIVTATEDVTWTEGSKAGLSIDFPDTSTAVIMRVKIKPLLAPGKLDQQHVNIFVGTEKVAEWLLSNNKFQEVELSIPQNLIEPTGKTLIGFELPDARSPLSLGTGKDKRVLALAFYSVQFEPTPEVLSPQQQSIMPLE
jgi:hypothetical protein